LSGSIHTLIAISVLSSAPEVFLFDMGAWERDDTRFILVVKMEVLSITKN
jgi:hypothetical protein